MSQYVSILEMPEQKKRKVIVILGPTASGKSALAVNLAKKIKGEVISADSRQVYRVLNLGTGKITKSEMRDVRHHLLDVANPWKQFSVALYKKLAEKALGDILRRGKIPIICGGTGLYIDTLINGTILPEVEPDRKLRKKLNRKTAKPLYEILKKLDPRRAREIDQNNPRRIIRAIEIARALGRVPTYDQQPTTYDTLKIGLRLPDNELKRKIHIRLFARMSRGMAGEVKHLRASDLSWKRLDSFGLEYRYLAKYLNNKISKKEMLAKLETETWRYAKRQITWFKRDKSIFWLDASKNGLAEKAARMAKRFLKGGPRSEIWRGSLGRALRVSPNSTAGWIT